MVGTDFNEMVENFEELMQKDIKSNVIESAKIVDEIYKAIERLQIEQKNQWVKEMERYVKKRALYFAQTHAVQLNLFERDKNGIIFISKKHT